jgi:hypothetical protein
MAVGIGGGGFVGLALETVANTYVAPTKFFPINSESLHYVQATRWRRPIRQNVDVLGGIPGDVHIEGDIAMEALEDVAAYFHHASRATVVKAGTPNYIYTFTPNALATPAKTLSITVVRNGVTYGYTGCVVSSFKYNVEDGALIATYSILGSDEASQSLPVMAATTTSPFGAGMYSIEIPTAAAVTDVDTFDFSVEDAGEPQFRLKNTGRGAQFIKYGERTCTLTLERDFQNRTDYDNFKALTSQAVTIAVSKGANNSITFLTPSSIKDTYEIGLSGQGDLLRAAITYQNTFDATAAYAYLLTIKTQENIT